MVNCYRCGRELTNGLSVQLGIGPVCRSRVKIELNKEIERSRRNSRCHHGLCCFNPTHGARLINRAWSRYCAIAAQTGSPIQTFAERIADAIEHYRFCFGHDTDRVAIPTIDVPHFSPETIVELEIESEPGPLGQCYKQPVDHDQQIRRKRLATQGVCPFGLYCFTPQGGLSATWTILYMLKDEVEPLLNTPKWENWGWDYSLYNSLAGIFEIHGQQEEANVIREVRDEQAARPRSYRLLF